MKATWLGEKDSVETNRQYGLTFKKGEALEIKDPEVFKRISRNKFFKTEGEAPKEDEGHQQGVLYRAPSAVLVEGAVPKPGEPVRDTTRASAPPKPQVDPEAREPFVSPFRGPEPVKPVVSPVRKPLGRI